MRDIGRELASCRLCFFFLCNIEDNQRDTRDLPVRYDRACVELIIPAIAGIIIFSGLPCLVNSIFLVCDFDYLLCMLTCRCGMKKLGKLRGIVKYQKIFSDTIAADLQNVRGGPIDAEHISVLAEKHNALLHVLRRRIEFFFLLPKDVLLEPELLLLAVEAVNQWRELIVGPVYLWLVQIYFVKRSDDSVRQAICQKYRK